MRGATVWKPIIYFDFKETEDKTAVVIDKTRLKEILGEVYQAGVADGVKDANNGMIWSRKPEGLHGGDFTFDAKSIFDGRSL